MSGFDFGVHLWMIQEMDDIELLREYAERRSEPAFTALVQRHAGLVYSVALRQVRDPHLAEEVTQVVFVILARKAQAIRKETILTGWLFRTTRFAAGDAVKMQIRRQRREQQSAQMETTATDEFNWKQIAPLLDEAVAGLGEQDRDAVLLRFFENKSLAQVGAALGTNEDAARKRIARAVEKLRNYFSKRGAAVTTAIIAGTVSANAVQAVPTGLISTVAAIAVVKGATVGGSTLTLIKGALKIMAWTKMRTTIVGGVGILLAIGTTTLTVKKIQEHRTYPWQVNKDGISDSQVNQPPQVRILPSKFQEPDWAVLNGKLIGLGVRAQNVIASAYDFITPARVTFSTKLPTGRYDYIACLSGGEDVNEKALQAAVKQKFDVAGKIETRNTAVWLLKVKSSNASGLKRNDKDYGNALRTTPNGFHGWNESMSNLAYLLEDMANVPVVDKTGLTNRFDFDLNCRKTDLENRDWNYTNEALDQLGLELVPTNMPIEMLVVEKVN
jgi:uncharacterized protein (TIGR03435 family)